MSPSYVAVLPKLSWSVPQAQLGGAPALVRKFAKYPGCHTLSSLVRHELISISRYICAVPASEAIQFVLVLAVCSSAIVGPSFRRKKRPGTRGPPGFGT